MDASHAAWLASVPAAAVGATLAALLWTHGRPTSRELRHLLLEAGVGLAAALAVVTTLLLARTGAPPHLSLLFRYARPCVRGGFGMLPIKPLVGMDLVIFLTYVATIAATTVRAVRGEQGRLLTGVLAWGRTKGGSKP